MKYIDYRSLKNFYSRVELCELYGMEKKELHAYCVRFSVELEKVDGTYGLTRHMVRHLHNLIYKAELEESERAGDTRREDPWND